MVKNLGSARKSLGSHSLILYGIILGFLYWILESLRDALVFQKGSFVERVLTPDPMAFWMRLLAVCIILLFALFAHAFLRERRRAELTIRQEQEKMIRLIEERTGGADDSHRLLHSLQQQMKERNQMESSFLESERKYRILMENIRVGVFRCTVGENGSFVDVNPHFVQMFGYEAKQDLFPFNFTDLFINPHDKQAFTQKLLSYGYVRDLDVQLLKRDGSLLWGSVTVDAIYDESGTIGSYDGVIHDITDRKWLEGEINRRAVYLEFLLNGIPDAVVTCDHRFRITDWNEAAERLFHYTKNETLGKKLHVIIGDPPVFHEMEMIAQNLKSGSKLATVEATRYRKDGSPVEVMLTASPIPIDEERVGYILIYTDISILKSTQQEKGKIQTQLIQAQKMEAIGILASGIAHDFNNLLTAILGCSDMAMMELNERDSIYGDLKQIRVSAGRAAELTRQLLLFSRKQPRRYAPVDLNDTIIDMQNMLQRVIGEDIAVLTELDDALWTFGGDRGNLEQVVMNLALNARDAMPEGGRLVIKTENVVLDKSQFSAHPETRPGKYIRLSVTDNGIGMDPETIKQIFDPFFSTKSAGKGTGLGLSVIYGIVKQHEGWINVVSQPSKGSTFEVYLPLRSAEKSKTQNRKFRMEDFVGVGKRILVVEDEEKVRDFTITGLNRNGYVAYGAADAEEAMALYKKEDGNFHMVLSDVGLPGKSGVELVKSLLELNPQLRVLFISGYSDHDARWPSIKEDGYYFLEKPYALSDLLRVVQEVVESEKEFVS